MLKKFMILYILTYLDSVVAIVKKTDVIFYLYTSQNKTDFILLTSDELGDIDIDISNPLKCIVHDFHDNAHDQWIKEMKNNYLTKDDYNVVVVDWTKVTGENYNEAALNIKDVGIYLAELIITLQMALGLIYEDVHLLGHGLGAHICGFAGKHIINNSEEKIARITGLDPAGPLFIGKNPKHRLSSEDALFIDVIHASDNLNGYSEPCGHADFFPNGGIAPQPDCLKNGRRKRNNGPTTDICSHSRSYIYQIESILSVGFVSQSCNSYKNYTTGLCNNNPTAIMGENIDIRTRGTYYLNTNASPPFAKE